MKFDINFNKENLNKKTIVSAVGAVVCLVVIIALFATRKGNLVKKNVQLEAKGQEYFYSGEYDKAIEEYNKIKTENLEDEDRILAWKNIKIAEAYSVKGDIKNSQKHIKIAKDSQSKEDEIINNIVFTEFMNGNVEEALKYGEEALKSNSQNKKLIKTMIAIYRSSGKNEEAEKLVKSYAVDKNSAYDMAEYSRLLMLIDDMDGGFSELKEAWNVNKDQYKIYDVLAQVSVYNRDLIIKSIKKLQENNPEDIAYKMWLAKVYSLSAEDSKQAEKLINELKNKEVGKIEIKLIEASVLQNLKKYDEANKLIDEVIKNNKDDYRVFHTAGWFYLKKNDLDKAAEYCKKSIEKNKNYPDNYAFLMPEILKKNDNSTASAAYFRTGMLKEPYNYNIIGNAANYYWYQAQNSEKALEYYKLASNIKPSEPEIKYNIALIYFNAEKDKEAAEVLEECVKLKENSIKYHRTLGTVYLTMGKSDKGIEEIRKAYKLNKNDILTLNNAACYYIMYTNDFNRGYYNLKQAVAGIEEDMDEYTKKVIKDNYDNVKSIIDKIEKGKGNESIKVPDFRLLY
ncbi:tetratricopeptide repeat protein [Clostridium ganghwense]|uniref:Tetratricopeptide repeat protein n=1 Tax=Clostridium ganghwense TaxID=312089 RepID=A0ABT4CPG0_9CLOT|nr:tetratricopeptide repeat protein [Clostridium ganghwense]MCY6370945.1 tetratricopeptide repeat protein [Clostridium ganghwense]